MDPLPNVPDFLKDFARLGGSYRVNNETDNLSDNGATETDDSIDAVDEAETIAC